MPPQGPAVNNLFPNPQPQAPAAGITPPSPSAASPGAAGPITSKWHDVTVLTKKKTQKACVEPVPPEEFGISRFARSLRQCGYCFHEVLKREEDAIAEGFDREQIKALPTWTMLTNPEELARDTVDEHLAAGGDQGINEANRQIKVTEHYIRMDYEGDGKAALYRMTTGSDQGEILYRDGKPDVHEVDMIPFAAMTPVIVTHRFFGRSIADLVMDIQRIKTALYRSILDNAYLAVNPRVEVASSHADEQTLDDLLVSRPGGIIRTKQPGGLQWQTVPAIAGEMFPVLEYVDATREWRTGVSRIGQGLDANSLQNQSATAAMQVYNAAQARMKLIARIFAETGIRDLFLLLHATIRKNGSQPQTVQLSGQWVNVDPREWKNRDHMTVNVGLGTGGRTERKSEIMNIMGMQKEALAGGLTNLVTPSNLYNSAMEYCKISEFKNADEFFTDPKTQPPPQQPPDPKVMQIQAQAELQQQKQKTDAAHQQAKLQADAALAQQKFDLEAKLAMLEHQMNVQSHAADLQHKAHAAQIDALQGWQKLELQRQAAADAQQAQQGQGNAD